MYRCPLHPPERFVRNWDSPGSSMHLWDLDLVIRENYTRASSESCICGAESNPGWLEKRAATPRDEKRSQT